jgi:predicted TIM-barrel fold metal-dependent hydrolase
VRAIDFHVHLPTPEWLDGSLQGYVEAAEAYFRSKVARKSLEELAREYQELDLMAVLLAWDAETATGRPRLSNEFVGAAVRDHPEVFTGFGSVDPHKGERAVAELDAIKNLGLKGVKLHPSLQAFDPSEESWWPLYERCQELGLACLFHTGTSGIGAGQPGGQGVRIDLARPILLDPVAAAFPRLQIIAAHFGYPWHVEMLAIALHKTNVWIDISGWAPRYIPSEVVRELKGRLQDRFLFGSDYPFIQPQRCLEELAELEIPEPVMKKLLVGNGSRLLGLESRAEAGGKPRTHSNPERHHRRG